MEVNDEYRKKELLEINKKLKEDMLTSNEVFKLGDESSKLTEKDFEVNE